MNALLKTTTSQKFRVKQMPSAQCLMTHRMCVSVCLHGVSSEARLRSGVMAACRSQGFVQFPIPILHSLSDPLRIYLHCSLTEMRGKDRREIIVAAGLVFIFAEVRPLASGKGLVALWSIKKERNYV